VWKARTAPSLLAELERSGAMLIEVEDGFIRSSGLGADCIPPLSIVVDRLGVHFDPRKPSELEHLIADGPFPSELIDRARLLRELIVSSGVGKYGTGSAVFERRGGKRAHVLVAGQVEDDRAITSSESGVKTNLDLLRRVREQKPDAYIIYKPHPDVEAGHRPGSLGDAECLRFTDEIVREAPITSLIAAADEMHVISSLAGFEALLRGKAVTTYGAPFYAGWGLTTDLGPVPSRRVAKRSVDQLVAAVLLHYPRYLDPVTGLPCPPEVLIRRLADSSGTQRQGIVVQLRRLQGRWKKRLARVGLGS
jgi:capsular polysaccharide export protein